MSSGRGWRDRVMVTDQVNEVTEVLLNLLRRQTPHQVQGTVQLLVTLKQTHTDYKRLDTSTKSCHIQWSKIKVCSGDKLGGAGWYWYILGVKHGSYK